MKTPQKHDDENYSEPEHVLERSNQNYQDYQNQPDYGRTDYGRTDYGRTDYGRTDYGRTDYGVSPSTSTSSSSRGSMSDEEYVNPKNPKKSNSIM